MQLCVKAKLYNISIITLEYSMGMFFCKLIFTIIFIVCLFIVAYNSQEMVSSWSQQSLRKVIIEAGNLLNKLMLQKVYQAGHFSLFYFLSRLFSSILHVVETFNYASNFKKGGMSTSFYEGVRTISQSSSPHTFKLYYCWKL